MSNLTQEIIALEQNRQAIVDAVNAKGGELAENAPLNAIAQAIEALPSGGGDYLQATLNRTITSIDMSDWNVTSILPDYSKAARSWQMSSCRMCARYLTHRACVIVHTHLSLYLPHCVRYVYMPC